MPGIIQPYYSKVILLFKITDACLIIGFYSILIRLFNEGLWLERDIIIVLSGALLYYFCATANNLYASWRVTPLSQEIFHTWVAWLLASSLMLFFAYFFQVLGKYTKNHTIIWIVTMPLVISFWHICLRGGARFLRKQGYNIKKVAIAGLTDLGIELSQTIKDHNWMGLVFKGFFDDRNPKGKRIASSNYPIVGSMNTLLEKAKSGQIDIIYITLPFQAERRVREYIYELSDTRASLYIAQDFSSFQLLHGRWLLMGSVPVVRISETPFYGVDGWLKRLEDIILSLLVIIVMAIPSLLLAIVVKLTSKGPVLFKQKRFGLNGKEIIVWKLRTMKFSENEAKFQQVKKGDIRITRIGRFLRRTSLDELPQFINTLCGSMSIVGPRPHPIELNNEYENLVDSYMLRHKVKPGITGLAQIKGWRGETDTLKKMEKRIEYDLQYIRIWSVALDLKIFILTIFRGFTDKNAY